MLLLNYSVRHSDTISISVLPPRPVHCGPSSRSGTLLSNGELVVESGTREGRFSRPFVTSSSRHNEEIAKRYQPEQPKASVGGVPRGQGTVARGLRWGHLLGVLCRCPTVSFLLPQLGMGIDPSQEVDEVGGTRFY